MYRVLLRIGNFTLYSYGVMLLIAYLLGVWIGTLEGKRRGIDPRKIEGLALWIILGGVIGARIWYVLEHLSEYSRNPFEIFMIWRGGLVFYGGFIGGFIGGILYLKISNLVFYEIADVSAPALALAFAIGRIGCFLNGCCYGKITNSWIGIRFPSRDLPPVYCDHLRNGYIEPGSLSSLPVIPTQLISSLDCFVIFLILWFLRKKMEKGSLFFLFLILYGIHRFIIDFFRYYEGNALILKYLTLSQVMSILFILTGTFMLLRRFNFYLTKRKGFYILKSVWRGKK